MPQELWQVVKHGMLAEGDLLLGAVNLAYAWK
jgi:hypothetical protein